MALKAHLETAARTAASLDPRSSDRRALRLEASGVLPGGLEANVLIHNVSTAGLLLETDLPLAAGEPLVIDLPEAGPVAAVIVWHSERLYGCAFEEALGDAAMAAVQLRADAPGAPAPLQSPVPLQSPAEPLGVKLNRLRKERGLTLAQVASVLDVSKPTVWAWEKGKARPLPDRIGAIAQVLGVTAQELEDRMGDQQHSALVQECRLRIATAYGTQPAKVRIMIEV